MKKTATVLSFLLLGAAAATPLIAAGGSAASTPSPQGSPSQSPSPQKVAQEHYRVGLSFRDKAWKFEEKLGKASTEAERAKLRKKMLDSYDRAAGKYRNAISRDEGLFQAHSSLGYALRKMGDYPAALKAYDRALELAPYYAEATEYRAEAYLGLNRLDEAKDAYMDLFRQDRPRADELLAAMQHWIEKRSVFPAGVEASTIDEFKAWVADRAELAEQSAQLSQQLNRPW